MKGKMSKNAPTPPPLGGHPSTTFHSFAGYPKIQNWTFVKTTLPVRVQESEPQPISNARDLIVRVTLLQMVSSFFWYPVGKRHNPNEVLVKVEPVQ